MTVADILPLDREKLLQYGDETMVILDGRVSLITNSNGTSCIRFFDKYLKTSRQIQVVMDNELIFESIDGEITIDQRQYI